MDVMEVVIENTSPTPKEAVQIQHKMREKIILVDDFTPIRTIAGIDVGYDPETNTAKAALVTMSIEDLKPIKSFIEFEPVTFPYIPGLLSFREAPVIIKALSHLGDDLPDILFVDGHGIAHPRRLGIATHIGVLTGLPTIGVAKKKLWGTYEEPALLKGSSSLLCDKGEIIGTVFRSKDNIKPLFISPGHRISHQSALDLVKRCLIKHRLPEPTRLADKLSKVVKENSSPFLNAD